MSFRSSLSTVAAATFVVGVATACNDASAQSPESVEPAAEAPTVEATRVEVATIAKSEANLSAQFPAEIEGSRDATLASSEGGPVERVKVDDGDRVDKGDVLVHVNTAMFQIQLEQTQAEIDQAKKDASRAEALGGAISEAERERAATRLRVLTAQKKMVQLRLGRSVIRAPFAGVVATVMVERGEVVAPAAPVLRLVQLDPIDVVLSVPDRDVVALEPGADVHVRVASQPGVRTGTIARVAPTGDQETRAFRAEIELANADWTLRPGMIAQVEIARSLGAGSLVIPQDWLVTRRDSIGVFVDADGVARWKEVSTDRIVRDQVVVSKGLAAGARVVITGQRLLADGDPLIVARAGRCCENGRAVF